jgi:hypothetical protein
MRSAPSTTEQWSSSPPSSSGSTPDPSARLVVVMERQRPLGP